MLTGKQRSYLKSLAHTMKPTAQLGKEGVSQSFLDQLSILLDQHELVKINILENSSESAENAANEICSSLNAEFVQAIGNKCTIYRQSRTDPMIEIPGADNTRVKINKKRKAATVKKAEPLTKKGGKKSRPLKGKRSAIKSRKAKVETAAAAAAVVKPAFKFFSKSKVKIESSESITSKDIAKASGAPKTFGAGNSTSKFKKFDKESKPEYSTKSSGSSRSDKSSRSSKSDKSSRSFKSNKRGQ